jgi:hypothetical protein
MAGGDEEDETGEILGWLVEELAGKMEGHAGGGYTCYGFVVDCSSRR